MVFVQLCSFRENSSTENNLILCLFFSLLFTGTPEENLFYSFIYIFICCLTSYSFRRLYISEVTHHIYFQISSCHLKMPSLTFLYDIPWFGRLHLWSDEVLRHIFCSLRLALNLLSWFQTCPFPTSNFQVFKCRHAQLSSD